MRCGLDMMILIDYYSDGLISCCYVVDNPVASFSGLRFDTRSVMCPKIHLFEKESSLPV